MAVTAILLKYHRPDEIEVIKKRLESYDFIDEILVHDNTKTNIMCYGRYVTAVKAKNSTIYVQDDDCIVDVQKLYDHYDKTKMVNGMKEEALSAYMGKDSLVGWGAFFEKGWIEVFDKYISKYGEDDVLIRESDRIFTSYIPRETYVIDVQDFPSAWSDDALWNQPEHLNFKQKALDRV